MPAFFEANPREMREVKNAFVAAFMKPGSGLFGVTCLEEDGHPQLLVTGREDVMRDLPSAFRGCSVRTELGRPGTVAVGSRFTNA